MFEMYDEFKCYGSLMISLQSKIPAIGFCRIYTHTYIYCCSNIEIPILQRYIKYYIDENLKYIYKTIEL